MGRVSDNRGLPFILWLLHIFLLLCLGSANAMYNGRLGVVKPDDPYLFVGEDLILFCNLTSLDQQVEDSSYLYFTQNGNRIPDDNITILTTRSIRLRSTIGRPDRDEGHFVCWLRQEHSNSRKTIGSQHVKADYSPVSVNDVNCTVYNWENMTCKWELGHNYRHPEYISVTLVWTIRSVLLLHPHLVLLTTLNMFYTKLK
ncbi:cytokine receptor-like factor 1 [Littorina saxatilis]|uniref:cytokine receptor-like factor 1 n=1 Tax=Littorina saxatilis TaxID=31220 RepID=UPI0038B53DCE